MQDIFHEKIVARKLRGIDYTLMVVILLACVSLAWFVGAYLGQVLPSIVPLVIFGICLGLYFGYQRFQVEHEYSFTNGELDIDRIIAKKKRKRLLSVDVRTFELLAPMRKAFAADFERLRPDATILDVASSPKAEGRWYAAFPTKGGGRTLMIFEPNDDIINSIAAYIPRKIQREPKA